MKTSRYTRLPYTLVVMLVLATLPAATQEGPARATLDIWLGQLNNASPEELREYASTAFSEAFLKQVPLDQLLQVHQQLKGAGSFELGPIESDSGLSLVALLHASSGPWFRAQLTVAGDPPKIEGFLIQPAQAPSESTPPKF